MRTINVQPAITRAHAPSGSNFSTLDGHRSLADLGFSADSLHNRGRELVRSEASPWENARTQNHRRNLFQVSLRSAPTSQISSVSMRSADATSASNAATAIKQEKYSTGLKLVRLFAQPQAIPDSTRTENSDRDGARDRLRMYSDTPAHATELANVVWTRRKVQLEWRAGKMGTIVRERLVMQSPPAAPPPSIQASHLPAGAR
jgi:hypothetical protein